MRSSQSIMTNRLRRTEALSGWAFVLPATILFLAFTFIPILSVFYYSLTQWNGMSSPVFVGFANFVDIFHNEIFFSTIANNFKFLALGVLLWTFFPLVIAALIFEGVTGWKFFRSAFFFPTVLSTVVTGTIFRSLFNSRGFFNTIMRAIHLDALAIDWWANGNLSIFLIVIVINWVGFGTPMLIYLAGMSNISDSIIEASQLDGANWFQRFRYIFMPSLKRLIQLNIVLNIMYCFTSLFSYIYIMTKGGPGYETTVIEYLIYLKAFTSKEMGYASSLSVVLGVIVALISAVQFLLFDRKKEVSV